MTMPFKVETRNFSHDLMLRCYDYSYNYRDKGIPQGSVETQLRCSGIFNNLLLQIYTECAR